MKRTWKNRYLLEEGEISNNCELLQVVVRLFFGDSNGRIVWTSFGSVMVFSLSNSSSSHRFILSTLQKTFIEHDIHQIVSCLECCINVSPDQLNQKIVWGLFCKGKITWGIFLAYLCICLRCSDFVVVVLQSPSVVVLWVTLPGQGYCIDLFNEDTGGTVWMQDTNHMQS